MGAARFLYQIINQITAPIINRIVNHDNPFLGGSAGVLATGVLGAGAGVVATAAVFAVFVGNGAGFVVVCIRVAAICAAVCAAAVICCRRLASSSCFLMASSCLVTA